MAKVIGHVDPKLVKHAPLDRDTPVYYSLAEQWEAWTAALTGLGPRAAYLKRSSGAVTRIRTLDVPDPRVDPHRLRAIEEFYLAHCFTPQEEVERVLHAMRRPAETSRMRRVS
jgi:hypothetical protein